MVSFPPCKINLGLHILSKRQDGYHEIDTCFYPVPWTDVLEIIPAQTFELHCTGKPVSGKPENNLCFKAYQLLKKDFDLPPVKIHLHKIIPEGAGLGGGSADGAHTLRLLQAIFKLPLSFEQCAGYAAQLGSDCAFFMQDQPMIGKGRGDILEPVDLNLAGYLVIVKPPVLIPTAMAYAQAQPRLADSSVVEILKMPKADWRATLSNDFEESIIRQFPMIADVKQKLYQAGAIYSAMSGSGSAVYGIFHNTTDLKAMFSGMDYWAGRVSV